MSRHFKTNSPSRTSHGSEKTPRKSEGPSTEALLKAILRLELEAQRERNENLTIGDQILILQDTGIAQGQAAGILGVPRNQIPSYLRRATNKKLLAKLVDKRAQKDPEEV